MLPPDNFLYFIILFVVNVSCATYLIFTYHRTQITLFNAIVFLLIAFRCCIEYYLPQVESFKLAQKLVMAHSFIIIAFAIIWICAWWYIRPFTKSPRERLINYGYTTLVVLSHLILIPALYHRIPFQLYPEKIDDFWQYYLNFSSRWLYYFYIIQIFFSFITLGLLVINLIGKGHRSIVDYFAVLFFASAPYAFFSDAFLPKEINSNIPNEGIAFTATAIVASWIFTDSRMFRGTITNVIEDTFNSISSFAIFTDTEFNILQWNQQASKFFELKNAESKLSYLLAGSSRMLHNDINTFLRSLVEHPNQERELLLSTSDKEFIFLAKASSYYKSGYLLGYTFFLEDITEERGQEKFLEVQTEQLKGLGEIKDRIFAVIGHDLRKPAIAFRGITKKVNYLLRKKDYETLNKLGVSIEQEAFALNKLTDNLLNWALTQKDVLPHNPEAIRLEELVIAVLGVFKKLAKEKRIELIADIPATLHVYADKNALHTIIRNLLDNAIKYTSNGRVEIVANEEGRVVRIQVRDTGVGIASDKLKDIFLLKQNKSEKGTAGEKGTGLGLHLIHELVELNEGQVEVESEIGKGTSFRLVLPSAKLKQASNIK